MSTGSFERPFDIEGFPPEKRKKLDLIRELARNISLENVEEFDRLMNEEYILIKQESERQALEFPPNPPNEKCHFALITGILTNRETEKNITRFLPFFQVGIENVYIWDQTKNNIAVFVVDVNYSLIPVTYWKNLASIIEITYAISTSFENVIECSYDWIYNFDSNLPIADNKFLYQENFERLSGVILNYDFFVRHSPIMELLIRDECFYVMCANLLASFNNHRFCVQCAFTPIEYQTHANHEIPVWEVAQAIPRMEVAIVQATRSVESALGKPGKKDISKKTNRITERWKSKIDIDPNSIYSIAGKPFLEYYYDLFDARNNAAHSLGQFPYKTSRQITIEAQCFAWLIVINYLNKNKLSLDEAKERLLFNQSRQS
ncbi:MAG: hypothetical protein FP831_08825 [Anaerolineae bacterium]|nr:hypothetical protein [Anaerolineae bacterium]